MILFTSENVSHIRVRKLKFTVFCVVLTFFSFLFFKWYIRTYKYSWNFVFCNRSNNSSLFDLGQNVIVIWCYYGNSYFLFTHLKLIRVLSHNSIFIIDRAINTYFKPRPKKKKGGFLCLLVFSSSFGMDIKC